MIYDNYTWAFQSALSDKFCDEIVKYALSKKLEKGVVGDFTKDPTIDKNKTPKERDSNVVWLKESWIYKEILPFINKANYDAGWNFHFDKIEQAQFTKYKLNQFYNWHTDMFPNSKIKRKISVTCQLSDPNDYQGGELEFDFRNYEPDKRKESNIYYDERLKNKGSVIVFPSFLWHRVKPVTKGTRYSLVLWCNGNDWK